MGTAFGQPERRLSLFNLDLNFWCAPDFVQRDMFNFFYATFPRPTRIYRIFLCKTSNVSWWRFPDQKYVIRRTSALRSECWFPFCVYPVWYAGAYTVQTNTVPLDTGRHVPFAPRGCECSCISGCPPLHWGRGVLQLGRTMPISGSQVQ